jgi:hypothetical protein
MVKAITFSTLLVLLVGTSAFGVGAAYQDLIFDVGLNNLLDWQSGAGALKNDQSTTLTNKQSVQSGDDTSANESLGISLLQMARTNTAVGGTLKVDSSLDAIGNPASYPLSGQLQDITGSSGNIGQNQGTLLLGSQVLNATGTGTAWSLDTFCVGLKQEASNDAASANELVSVEGSLRKAHVNGENGDSIGDVTNKLTLPVLQTQSTTNATGMVEEGQGFGLLDVQGVTTEGDVEACTHNDNGLTLTQDAGNHASGMYESAWFTGSDEINVEGQNDSKGDVTNDAATGTFQGQSAASASGEVEQEQNYDVGMDQNLTSTGQGGLYADASHAFDLNLCQVACNSAGGGFQTASLVGNQSSTIDSENGAGEVTAGMTATVTQTQSAN